MNPKYDTKLKVKDMEGEDFQLVQSEFDIRQFNAEYQEDFTYYFIKWVDECSGKIFGCDSLFLHNNVYYVADF